MKNMNKTFRKIGTAIMGLALLAGLATSCSNGDWEDSLQGGTGNGGNNGKITVSFAMQAPIRVITLGNDDDAVNTDDNAHQRINDIDCGKCVGVNKTGYEDSVHDSIQ